MGTKDGTRADRRDEEQGTPDGPPKTPQRADTDSYDPVGMAGKPAGIVEELRDDVEERPAGSEDRKVGAAGKDEGGR